MSPIPCIDSRNAQIEWVDGKDFDDFFDKRLPFEAPLFRIGPMDSMEEFRSSNHTDPKWFIFPPINYLLYLVGDCAQWQ